MLCNECINIRRNIHITTWCTYDVTYTLYAILYVVIIYMYMIPGYVYVHFATVHLSVTAQSKRLDVVQLGRSSKYIALVNCAMYVTITSHTHNDRTGVAQIIQVKPTGLVLHIYRDVISDLLRHRQLIRVISY